MRVIVVQLVTIFEALDCITQYEIIVRPYDRALVGRLEITIAIG